MKTEFCFTAHAHFEADSPVDAATRLSKYFQALAVALEKVDAKVDEEPAIPAGVLDLALGSQLELRIYKGENEVLH